MYKIFLTIFCFLNFTFLFCQGVRTRWSVGLDALALTPINNDIYGEISFAFKESNRFILGLGVMNYDFNKVKPTNQFGISLVNNGDGKENITKNLSLLIGFSKKLFNNKISPSLGGGYLFRELKQFGHPSSRLIPEHFDTFYFFEDKSRLDWFINKEKTNGLFLDFSFSIKLNQNLNLGFVSRSYVNFTRFELTKANQVFTTTIAYYSYTLRSGNSQNIEFRPFERVMIFYNF
jgi:hypothetical protein